MGYAGDTKIVTVYEGQQSIKDLYESGKDILVYTWNAETKLPEVSMMHDFSKVEDQDILELGFDSGLAVRCTPEQEFYTFRGNKETALGLNVGQSVRAFSMSIHRDGHLRVHGWVDGKAKHSYAARMIWEYYNGPVPEGMIIHHRDFVKLNNRIENFQLVTNAEHNSIHYPFRRDGGFFHKNHKAVSILVTATKESVYTCIVDKTHAFIIGDPTPVSGLESGIVAVSL